MAYGDPVPCKSCSKPITFEKKPDGEGYNRFNPDGSPHIDERKNGGGGGYRGKSPEEQRSIVRQSALKSAVAFAGARMAAGDAVTGEELIKLADAFVKWLEKAP